MWRVPGRPLSLLQVFSPTFHICHNLHLVPFSSSQPSSSSAPCRFFYAGALPLVGVLIVTGLLTMPAKHFVPLSVRIDVGLAWFAALSTLILVPTDVANALQVCRANVLMAGHLRSKRVQCFEIPPQRLPWCALRRGRSLTC